MNRCDSLDDRPGNRIARTGFRAINQRHQQGVALRWTKILQFSDIGRSCLGGALLEVLAGRPLRQFLNGLKSGSALVDGNDQKPVKSLACRDGESPKYGAAKPTVREGAGVLRGCVRQSRKSATRSEHS